MDSQCGRFKFENKELTGCILTCSDDGCNGSKSLLYSDTSVLLALATALILIVLPSVREDKIILLHS